MSLNETYEDLNGEEISLNLLSYLPVSVEKMRKFQIDAQNDFVMKRLKEIVIEGRAESKTTLDIDLQSYGNFRDEISIGDNMIFKSHKLIVPKSLRPELLDKIHEAHLGITKCKSRARETLF